MPLLGDERRRVYDRRGVHEELNHEVEGVLYVSVLDGQRGEPQAEAHRRGEHDEHQQRQGEDAPVRHDAIEGHHAGEHRRGDGEVDQFREDARQGEDHPRKVDLAYHLRLIHEAVAGLEQRIGEVGPGDESGEAEDAVGDAVRIDLGEVAEDDGEDDHREERLDDSPADADGTLSVEDLDAPPGEKPEHVAILVELAEVDEAPAGGGFDDGDVRRGGRRGGDGWVGCGRIEHWRWNGGGRHSLLI